MSFQSLPGITNLMLPEGLRSKKYFTYVIELMDALFANDIRYLIYKNMDGIYDPWDCPNPAVLIKQALSLTDESVQALFNGDERKMRVFLYYLPASSSGKFSLQWYSTISYLISGQLVQAVNDSNCKIVVRYPDGASADEANQILNDLMNAHRLMCKIDPPTPTPTTDPIPLPGC